MHTTYHAVLRIPYTWQCTVRLSAKYCYCNTIRYFILATRQRNQIDVKSLGILALGLFLVPKFWSSSRFLIPHFLKIQMADQAALLLRRQLQGIIDCKNNIIVYSKLSTSNYRIHRNRYWMTIFIEYFGTILSTFIFYCQALIALEHNVHEWIYTVASY